ncbi:MAG: hypothetical protein A2Y64_05410 [Candidatus Coatesbacteria bacterium RBG_13_66_14]|uniref:DUF4159 domain-containing protein n=1 Tax=Candidatus Coatesbacteria bacterium RBG_13_66_14 TaxID=1817816 RepID=A0A1F5F7D6_9BACT|nr:MAG: hypothetical protein A2Y64_05410 [Candidatus Coatesbacteria bacterium RBG_13_66_14]
MRKATLHILLLFAAAVQAAEPPAVFTVARLHYGGGGDWYSDPSSLPNLLKFLHDSTGLEVASDEAVVEPASPELSDYPYLYLTGHGNVSFTPLELERLRSYLDGGGFLHVDDNYGLDPYIRREISLLYPDEELVQLPFDHPIYHCFFDFPQGPPKVHEHDGEPPQGYGIFRNGRLVLFYTHECDLGDGWEDPEVHKDPQEIREAALEMGVNIIIYALTH